MTDTPYIPTRSDHLRWVAELIYLYDNEDREQDWYKACNIGREAYIKFLNKRYPRNGLSWASATQAQIPLLLRDWFMAHRDEFC